MKLFKSKRKDSRDPTGTKSSSARPASVLAMQSVNTTPDISAPLNPLNCGSDCARTNQSEDTSKDEIIDAYELRIEELGGLMVEQGRQLDEKTERCNLLASENNTLREKVSSGLRLENLKSHNDSLQIKSPLKSIINQRKVSADEQARIVQKYKDENSLLQQQAELLVKELEHANGRLSDQDLTVASLEKELKTHWEQCGKLTTEKSILRNRVIEKNLELETVKHKAHELDKLRSQQTSRANQLLSERLDLEKEVETLAMQVKHSSNQIETLNQQLSRQNKAVDDLTEANHVREREKAVIQRDARMKEELAASLDETLRQVKGQSDQLSKMLKDTKDKLAESKININTLETTIFSLRSELLKSTDRDKETLASFTQGQDKLLFTLKQEHASKIHSLEKSADDLHCLNSLLENDRAKLERDKQSSDKRCAALEKLLSSKEQELKALIKSSTDRALDAEARLDSSLSSQLDLKRKVVQLEEAMREIQETSKRSTSHHNKKMDSMQIDLANAQQENKEMANGVAKLQNQLEAAQREHRKEKDKMIREVEQQIQDTQVELKAMQVSRSNAEQKAKEARQAYETAVKLHDSTVEQLQNDSKDVRIQLEKVISDERTVSQRLMSKIQEINQTVQLLTLDKHQNKMQVKEYAAKNDELECVLASGEVKLRNLTCELTKSIGEQERLIKIEAELRMELQKAHYDLEKSRGSSDTIV